MGRGKAREEKMGSRQAESIAPTKSDRYRASGNEDSDVYQELFRLVDRDSQYLDADRRVSGNYEGTPVSDRVHRLKVLALLHARAWADEAGIAFEWTREQPHVTCCGCGDQYDCGTTQCPQCNDVREVDRHDHTWRCWAVMDGNKLTWEGDWDFGHDAPPSSELVEDSAVVLLGECRLSQVLMGAVTDACSRDEQSNACFADGPGGRLVLED